MVLSLVELWEATGPLARGVVGVLGIMSVSTGAVAVEKWRRLRRAERESARMLAEWRAAAANDTPLDVPGLARRHPASPVAALLARVGAASWEAADAETRRELHDRTVRQVVLLTGAELKRGLGVLATVGATAPFVGLFGTVIGIINAFHELGSRGGGGAGTVSTGIAEALVATAVGILVAIPAVWLFNHLSQRITRLLAGLEAAGEELALARLSRRHRAVPAGDASDSAAARACAGRERP